MGKRPKEGMISDRENEWLKLIYEEAWRQYIHEDEMAEQRDSKYLTVLSIIFSAIGVIAAWLIPSFHDMDFSVVKNCYYILTMLVIVFVALVIIFIFALHWRRVTETGQEYTKIRFDVAKEIEKKINIDITIGRDEEEKLKNIRREKRRLFGGFESTKSITCVFLIMSVFLMFVVILLVITILVRMF